MAQFVLGDQDIVRDISPRENDNTDNDNGDSETSQGGIEGDKRHYKKDSRYLEDLYTLTYNEDSSIDQEESFEIETIAAKKIPVGMTSLQVPKNSPKSRFSQGLVRSQSSGPMSLTVLNSRTAMTEINVATADVTADPKLQFASSTLDTNLHKILARRLAGGQPVSYDSCKLLTKAYYKLLRDPAVSQVGLVSAGQGELFTHNTTDTINWQSLVGADKEQLKKIVAGYTGLARSLNDQLMQELITKDELLAKQDMMLDTISEMTDNLL